jgi:hypothetical protein
MSSRQVSIVGGRLSGTDLMLRFAEEDGKIAHPEKPPK